MKKTLLATFIIAMASTAYATTTGRTLSTEPFVVDGYTPDTRSSEAKETYANRVTKSDVEGNNHSVMGQDNTVLAEHGSTSVFGNQNTVGVNAKDGNIFGDGSSINGYQSQAGGDNNILSGEQDSSFGMNNVIIGNHTHAYGGGNNVTGDQSLAVGHYNLIKAPNSVAIGYDNKALLNETTVVGSNSVANGLNASAFGSKATATGESSLAMGTGANATADSTVAIGNDSNATGKSSVAVGESTNATGVFSTALGDSATATGNRTVAISVDSVAKGDESIAIGAASKTDEGVRTIAIGAKTEAQGESATVIGSHSTGKIRSTVIGAEANAEVRSFAGAYQANATGQSSVALGDNANATHDNSVALGSQSVSKIEKQVTTATVGTNTYNGFAGTNPIATVSVGAEGKERQIVNVGAGEISATSTDAINGSQLYAVASKIGESVKVPVVEQGKNVTVDVSTNANGQTVYTVNAKDQKDYTPEILANTKLIKENSDKIATNTADIRSAEKLIDANAKNIAENTKAIEGNTNYIKSVEAKLPEVKSGDNTTVTTETDANGKVTYTVSSKDYQPEIDKVDAKAEANKENIAENTKAIKENAKGVAENKVGIESNKAKIAEVEQEAKRHTVVKSGKHTTVEKSTGTDGESVYTVNADVDHLATKAEVNEVSKVVTGNTKAIQENARKIGNLDHKINKVEKKARAGIASAIAVANIPQVTIPGKSALGVGVGGHHNQHAIATRYTRMSDNGKWIISGSVGVTTQREVNYGAGVTYQW